MEAFTYQMKIRLWKTINSVVHGYFHPSSPIKPKKTLKISVILAAHQGYQLQSRSTIKLEKLCPYLIYGSSSDQSCNKVHSTFTNYSLALQLSHHPFCPTIKLNHYQTSDQLLSISGKSWSHWNKIWNVGKGGWAQKWWNNIHR